MAHYRIIDRILARRDHSLYRQSPTPALICADSSAAPVRCGPSGLVFSARALCPAARGQRVPQLRQRVRNDEAIEYDSLAVIDAVMTVGDSVRCGATMPEFSPPFDVRPRRRLSRQERPRSQRRHHRRWRAFYLRQLSAMAPSPRRPIAECRRRGGPRAHLGKLQNGVIPVAGRFNHCLCRCLHAIAAMRPCRREINDPERHSGCR